MLLRKADVNGLVEAWVAHAIGKLPMRSAGSTLRRWGRRSVGACAFNVLVGFVVLCVTAFTLVRRFVLRVL